MLDYLDRCLVFRSLFIAREDCLNDFRTLNVLIAIRHCKRNNQRCNYTSIDRLMRNVKRTMPIGVINRCLRVLASDHYITLTGRTGTNVTLTESGKQVLADLNSSLTYAVYSRKHSNTLPDIKRPKGF